MINLRNELRNLLADEKTAHPATIRRCRQEDYLYATNLPQLSDEENILYFIRNAETSGWRTEMKDGWILLDRIPEEPPKRAFPEITGPEAGCCASLLQRHPQSRGNEGSREIRMLIKAGEENAEAYERVCGILHREWSAALRNGLKLPEISLSYFREESEL